MEIHGHTNTGKIRIAQMGLRKRIREERIESGDEVMYNANLLATVTAGRSKIGATRGQIKHAKGRVLDVSKVSKSLSIALVRWEGRGADVRVSTDNLVRIDEE